MMSCETKNFHPWAKKRKKNSAAAWRNACFLYSSVHFIINQRTRDNSRLKLINRFCVSFRTKYWHLFMMIIYHPGRLKLPNASVMHTWSPPVSRKWFYCYWSNQNKQNYQRLCIICIMILSIHLLFTLSTKCQSILSTTAVCVNTNKGFKNNSTFLRLLINIYFSFLGVQGWAIHPQKL